MKVIPLVVYSIISAATLSVAVVELDIQYQPNPNSIYLSRRDSINAPVWLYNYAEYMINVTVGTPPQYLNVTLDTGSSGTWIPASTSTKCRQRSCDGGSFDPRRSRTYKLVQQGTFNITYAMPYDWDAGDVVSDVFSVGGNQFMKDVEFGLVYDGYDSHGVLGIGYDDGKNDDGPHGSVMDNMYTQGLIQRRAFSLYLGDTRSRRGSVLFGGVDSAKYTGELIALPMQRNSNGNYGNFEVTLTSVSFTGPTGQMSQLTASGYRQNVLLDVGTTGTLLDPSIYAGIVNGLGGVFVEGQWPSAPCKYADVNGTINYQFGGSNGPIIKVPLSQIFSGQTYDSNEFNDASGGCALLLGTPIIGLSILGGSFLQSAYVVFDSDNMMIGMAQAALNRGSVSSITTISSGSGIPGATRTASVSGTVLEGVVATASPNVRTVTGSSVSVGTPTFSLGASPSQASSSTPATSTAGGVRVQAALPTAALLGFGMLAGAGPVMW